MPNVVLVASEDDIDKIGMWESFEMPVNGMAEGSEVEVCCISAIIVMYHYDYGEG